MLIYLFIFGFCYKTIVTEPISQDDDNYSLDISGCGILEKKCSHLSDDLAILSCSLNLVQSNKTQLTFTCQHKLWMYRKQMLYSDYLKNRLAEPCISETLVSDCLNFKDSAIDCILKRKLSIKDTICWAYVKKIQTLVPNDWQITQNFLNYCAQDIDSHTCGRIPTDSKSLSQSQTLLCLQNVHELNSQCETEVAALKQIKYLSLQLDKMVFAACNLDQKNFCGDEIHDTWLMYKCLIRHKYDDGMSRKCQDQLLYDQRSIVINYRMSKGLVKSCKEDIRKYHCRKGVVEDKEVKLAQILLCLENVSRNESVKLSQECILEMIDHRKMLMDDYRLSPELMQNCGSDIKTFCKGVEAGGKTIHCLMEHAQPRRRKDKRISLECQNSLGTLIETANPGEDWRVDPILRKACKQVVDSACSEVSGGNGRVISCLMEKLGTTLMNTECETALMQIQYFISRDFKLDPQLFKACKYDAVTQCKAKLQWANINEHPSDKDPWILPCLYKYAYNTELNVKLKPACEQQVRRVMRQRAISVDLLPEIEDFCIDDLANMCFENTGKGEEIQCLQSKIKDLSVKCREAVNNFTETQSGHIELNSVVNVNCRSAIDKLCSSEAKAKSDVDDVMDCLISHKNDIEIKTNLKCKAAIDHEQLISIKSYRFTRRFKNACKSYVVRFCPDAQTKSEVIKCLSERVRNDTINSKKHSIPKDCRQQLRSQLFQQRENIDLDPETKEACKKDLQEYCNNVPHGNSAALECLQTYRGELSSSCKKALFIIKKQEFSDNAVDFHLFNACNNMIDMYCHNTDSSNILNCLKVHKDKLDFDDSCKVVVINRLIEQYSDYRLNNNLQSSCRKDINHYCMNIIVNEPKDEELHGKVLQCLKSQFRANKLSAGCKVEIADILKEQAMNYRLDPLLAKLCQAEIKTICSVPNDSITKSDGQVEECLKRALLEHRIISADCASEIAQIVEEAAVDIDADPLLERACAMDLLKYCETLDHGDARKLKCLILIYKENDGRKLDPACEKELSSRLEMYRFITADNVVSGFSDIYSEINLSPVKKYIMIVSFSVIGLIFILGMYCGKMTRRAMYIKRK